MTRLGYRSDSQFHGRLRISFKIKLICIFALGSLIYAQYGIKVVFCSRVDCTKV